MSNSFEDTVLQRRLSFIEDEEKAAKELQKILRKIRDEASASLEELVKQYSEDGSFEKSQQAIRAAKRKLDQLQTTIDNVIEMSTDTLIENRESSFRQGVLDIAYTIDKEFEKSNFEIKGSFDVVSKKAAEFAATKPVLGIKPEDAFKGVKGSIEKKYQQVFLTAIVGGQSTKQTAQRLQDINGITERAATRIARTNLNAAMNDGFRETIEENDEIFDGYVWNSTLDKRTSEICQKLDGRFFPLGTNPPGPPAHPNCRSTLIPHFKDQDVQKFLEKQDRRVRDSKTGRTKVVKGGIQYSDWLKTQE